MISIVLIKLLEYNFFSVEKKMEKFTGKIVAKKRASVKPSQKEGKKEVKVVEDDLQEKFLLGVVQELTGYKLTLEAMKRILSNLNIDSNKEMSDDDLLLIYNVFTEPLISRDDNEFQYKEKLLTAQKYTKELEEDSALFKKVLPNQRVQAMYEFLPSLEINRINFRIDKDIFRNKPLLGKGLYKCSRCGSDDTEDYEKQTRSADEPMTVFVTCRNCGAKFKFN
jgi:DNA-directed RNA polymerase subunit M/transcription elongation factor TFIIS